MEFLLCKFQGDNYHSQNLMKVGKKIGVIDSQDALIGNPAYDLVSLIDDVRIKTSNKLKNKLSKHNDSQNSSSINNHYPSTKLPTKKISFPTKPTQKPNNPKTNPTPKTKAEIVDLPRKSE